MIYLFYQVTDSVSGEIVSSAMKRSCGLNQVISAITINHNLFENDSRSNCLVFLDPPDSWSDYILHFIRSVKSKIIILGALPFGLSEILKATIEPLDDTIFTFSKCPPAKIYNQSESIAKINYLRSPLADCYPIEDRPFMRFDFTDEWNNLGYGAIRADNSIWAIRQKVQIDRKSLIAEINLGNRRYCAYSGLWDWELSSLLWFNRSVGPVDSQEWRIIEHFIANYRSTELPCFPVIAEIPYPFTAAVTMRLDCDEDIQSGQELLKLYNNLSVPLSLAIHTSLISDSTHLPFIKMVKDSGGAVLSHSATHPTNWGGSYDAALKEAIESASIIRKATGIQVRYAVSPFHQNPSYAIKALSDAGYDGCIGGIIRNDPDFLMARGGAPPGVSTKFTGHTQQCMLHGDCMRLEDTDPLVLYKHAFELSKAGQSFFGYLDHPFSKRYQYGWECESQRLSIHRDFINYMKESGKTLFCNEDEAIDFIKYKSLVKIIPFYDYYKIECPIDLDTQWPVAIEYENKRYCCASSCNLSINH